MTNFLKRNRLNEITKKSTSILSVFQKTQDDLIATNAEIDTEITEQEKIKAEANANINSLSALKTQHQGVIDKIKNFLA